MEKFICHPVLWKPENIKNFWVEMYLYLSEVAKKDVVGYKLGDPKTTIGDYERFQEAKDKDDENQKRKIHIKTQLKHDNNLKQVTGFGAREWNIIVKGPKLWKIIGWLEKCSADMVEYLKVINLKAPTFSYVGTDLFDLLSAIRNIISHLQGKPRLFFDFKDKESQLYWEARWKVENELKDWTIPYWMKTVPEFLFCSYEVGVALPQLTAIPKFPLCYYPGKEDLNGMPKSMLEFVKGFKKEINNELETSKGYLLYHITFLERDIVFLRYKSSNIIFPVMADETLVMKTIGPESMKHKGQIEIKRWKNERNEYSLTMDHMGERSFPVDFPLIIYGNDLKSTLKLAHFLEEDGTNENKLTVIFTQRSFEEIHHSIEKYKKAFGVFDTGIVKRHAIAWSKLHDDYKKILKEIPMQLHRESKYHISLMKLFQTNDTSAIRHPDGDQLLHLMHTKSPVLLKRNIGGFAPLPKYIDRAVILQTGEGIENNCRLRENDMLESLTKTYGQLLLIHAHFGMGKSCLLRNLGEKLTTFSEGNLLRYSTASQVHEAFQQAKQPINGFENLWAFWNEGDYEKAVLRRLVTECGVRIILLLDGFDEIEGSQRKKVLDMLSRILKYFKNRVNIVVATRSNFVDTVQSDDRFKANTVLRYKLACLSDEGKVGIILSHWGHFYTSTDAAKVEKLAKNIVKKAEKEVGDLSASPMVCKLLAGIYYKNIKNKEYDVEISFSSSRIYDAIIESTVLECFAKHTVKTHVRPLSIDEIDVNSFTFVDIRNIISYFHEIQATSQKLGDEPKTMKSILSKCDLVLESETNIYRVGMLDLQKTFALDILADYFLAKYVFNTMYSLSELPSGDSRMESFISKVITSFLQTKVSSADNMHFKLQESVRMFNDMLLKEFERRNRNNDAMQVLSFCEDKNRVLCFAVRNGFNGLLWAILDSILKEEFDELSNQPNAINPALVSGMIRVASEEGKFWAVRYLLEKCNASIEKYLEEEIRDMYYKAGYETINIKEGKIDF